VDVDIVTAMSSPPTLDYTANQYIAVTISTSTLHNPSQIATSTLKHVGPVGALDDVHLFSVSKADWPRLKDETIAYLRAKEGVVNVEVQEPRARAKRSEF